MERYPFIRPRYTEIGIPRDKEKRERERLRKRKTGKLRHKEREIERERERVGERCDRYIHIGSERIRREGPLVRR